MARTRKSRPNDPSRFSLFIEDDGPQGLRQLEYACVCKMTAGGPKLVIDGVRNAVTNEIINDTNLLPDPQIVMEAARLYDWHYNHQPVFDEGRSMPCPK